MVLRSDRQESSPQEVLISSLLSTQEQNRITRHKCHGKFELGKRETHLVWGKPMHNHCCWFLFFFIFDQRQRSGGTQLRDNRRRTGWQRAQAGLEQCVSNTTAVPPSHQTAHFQTVGFNLDSMAVRSYLRQQKASVFRRKWPIPIFIRLNKHFFQKHYVGNNK